MLPRGLGAPAAQIARYVGLQGPRGPWAHIAPHRGPRRLGAPWASMWAPRGLQGPRGPQASRSVPLGHKQSLAGPPAHRGA